VGGRHYGDELSIERNADELLRTELDPELELGPAMGTIEIINRNLGNRYEREYDGLSIKKQWTDLMLGDTSMDGDNWKGAIAHFMRLCAFYTDDPEQVLDLYRRSKLSLPVRTGDAGHRSAP
jgi:hypothetical protein